MTVAESPHTAALDFVRGCDEAYPGMQRLSLAGAHLDRVLYLAVVEVPHFDRQHVSVLVDERDTSARPCVWAADPRPMKHQFVNRAMCIWSRWDPPDKRWGYEDGLAALFDLAKLHLYREERYRETHRWMGPEAPHNPPTYPGAGAASAGKG